jgi:hypothetical protein
MASLSGGPPPDVAPARPYGPEDPVRTSICRDGATLGGSDLASVGPSRRMAGTRGRTTLSPAAAEAGTVADGRIRSRIATCDQVPAWHRSPGRPRHSRRGTRSGGPGGAPGRGDNRGASAAPGDVPVRRSWPGRHRPAEERRVPVAIWPQTATGHRARHGVGVDRPPPRAPRSRRSADAVAGGAGRRGKARRREVARGPASGAPAWRRGRPRAQRSDGARRHDRAAPPRERCRSGMVGPPTGPP